MTSHIILFYFDFHPLYNKISHFLSFELESMSLLPFFVFSRVNIVGQKNQLFQVAIKSLIPEFQKGIIKSSL